MKFPSSTPFSTCEFSRQIGSLGAWSRGSSLSSTVFLLTLVSFGFVFAPPSLASDKPTIPILSPANQPQTPAEKWLGLREGLTGVPTVLSDWISQVKPGSIVFFGEVHGTCEGARAQMEILQSLRHAGHSVSLGMEFFSWQDQALVDAFRNGEISEAEFLSKINWGTGFPFTAYREQVAFVQSSSQVVALNAPRSLTRRIARVGLGGLLPEELALLPSGFSLGRDTYRNRFSKVMEESGHATPEMIERLFAAQSAWDDTMADRALAFLRSHPNEVLFVVVGEFHTQFGGGLPYRFKIRAPEIPQLNISMINQFGLSEAERADNVLPSLLYGPRADLNWAFDLDLDKTLPPDQASCLESKL